MLAQIAFFGDVSKNGDGEGNAPASIQEGCAVNAKRDAAIESRDLHVIDPTDRTLECSHQRHLFAGVGRVSRGDKRAVGLGEGFGRRLRYDVFAEENLGDAVGVERRT